jgi:hypothetical protein
MSASPDNTLDQTSPELKLAFEKYMQKHPSRQKTLSRSDRELLFAQFVKFLAQSKREQAAAH